MATVHRWRFDDCVDIRRLLYPLSLGAMYSSLINRLLSHSLGDSWEGMLVQDLQEIQPSVATAYGPPRSGFHSYRSAKAATHFLLIIWAMLPALQRNDRDGPRFIWMAVSRGISLAS